MELLTQARAATRLRESWGISIYQGQLSVLSSIGAGPEADGKRYTVEAIDAWAAAELRKRIAAIETQAAELHATIARMGY